MSVAEVTGAQARSPSGLAHGAFGLLNVTGGEHVNAFLEGAAKGA